MLTLQVRWSKWQIFSISQGDEFDSGTAHFNTRVSTSTSRSQKIESTICGKLNCRRHSRKTLHMWLISIIPIYKVLMQEHEIEDTPSFLYMYMYIATNQPISNAETSVYDLGREKCATWKGWLYEWNILADVNCSCIVQWFVCHSYTMHQICITNKQIFKTCKDILSLNWGRWVWLSGNP